MASLNGAMCRLPVPQGRRTVAWLKVVSGRYTVRLPYLLLFLTLTLSYGMKGTVLTIDPEGKLLSSHRKLMPTGSERLVWGQGDGAGIRVVNTPAGRLGACICWEVSAQDGGYRVL